MYVRVKTGDGGYNTHHVMQPVRTFGLLALVLFLGGSEGPPADEGEGLPGLLQGSTLERLDEYADEPAMVRSTKTASNNRGLFRWQTQRTHATDDKQHSYRFGAGWRWGVHRGPVFILHVS